MELMIALFVLGLGLVSLFNLFPLAWQALSYSRKLNEVATLAEKKLEELKAQPDKILSGQTSGENGDLNWAISAQPRTLTEGVKVTYVELDIDFSYQKQSQKQRFVTYIFGD